MKRGRGCAGAAGKNTGAEITAERDRNWKALSVKEIWVLVGPTRREAGGQGRWARETRGQWPFRPAHSFWSPVGSVGHGHKL